MLLQNKKQEIQKTWGTEDKVYQTDTIRPLAYNLAKQSGSQQWYFLWKSCDLHQPGSTGQCRLTALVANAIFIRLDKWNNSLSLCSSVLGACWSQTLTKQIPPPYQNLHFASPQPTLWGKGGQKAMQASPYDSIYSKKNSSVDFSISKLCDISQDFLSLHLYLTNSVVLRDWPEFYIHCILCLVL